MRLHSFPLLLLAFVFVSGFAPYVFSAEAEPPTIVETEEGKVWRLTSVRPDSGKTWYIKVGAAKVEAEVSSYREIRLEGEPRVIDPSRKDILWRTAHLTFQTGKQRERVILVKTHQPTYLLGLDSETGALVKIPLADVASITVPPTASPD